VPTDRLAFLHLGPAPAGIEALIMEEDLVGLSVAERPDQKSSDGFRRLGVLVGTLCAVAWGLFAVYVFFKEKVTLNNIGFFFFLFLVCLPAYYVPYGLMRLVGRVVDSAPKAREEY
jgi:hypothetical protein